MMSLCFYDNSAGVLPWQVVCPSVCLSVTLMYRGHLRSNSWIIISRLISLTFLFSTDANFTDLLQTLPNFSRKALGMEKLVLGVQNRQYLGSG